MPVTLELSGVSVSQVEPVVSPLAELQAFLHALAEPDHHLDARGLLERIGGALSTELRSELMHFAPLWARRRSRLLLPLALPSPVPLETELARLAAVPDDRFFDSVAHTIHGGVVETFGLFADPGRHGHFVEDCERRSFSRGDLARSLVADPGSFRASLLAVLERCREEFFDAEWGHLRGRLTDEVTRLRAQRHRSPVDMLCAVSASAVRVGDTSVVRFDKLQNLRVTPEARTVFLVPTVVGRPHLIVRGEPPYPVVVQFPISTPGALATLVEVQTRLATLSDPNRLAICRHLVNEAITTSDLARRVGMAPPQVSRHLARLREVGLLVSERDGRFVYHRLDVTAVMQLGPQLISAIVR